MTRVVGPVARAALAALACVASCGGSSESDGADAAPVAPGTPDGVCPADVVVGSFEAELRDGFTSVQGKVESGVTPFRVPELIASEGACRFMRPAQLFCDPPCGSDTTCDATGACVPTPVSISVGVVTATGLASPIEMTASPPVYFYTNRDPLAHPGFAEGAELQLRATGDGDVAAFTLDARGIAALAVIGDSVALQQDQIVALQWTPAAQPGLGEIYIDLNIAQHGGNPGWIECVVDDTGSFELPVALTNQLLANGFSGFPSLAITRRSADHTDTSAGCVQWVALSTATLPVEIPGLTSCSDDEDCPPGQTCQGDLTCG